MRARLSCRSSPSPREAGAGRGPGRGDRGPLAQNPISEFGLKPAPVAKAVYIHPHAPWMRLSGSNAKGRFVAGIISDPAIKKRGPTSAEQETSGIVGAVLMPHAPILVPSVGRKRGDLARASQQAMRAVADWCVRDLQPETVLVISPHSPRKPGAFGLWTGDPLNGSFAPFAAPQTQIRLPNDPKMREAVSAQAHSRGLSTWLIPEGELDHGALVPLWFLVEAGWLGPTLILSLNYPGGNDLVGLGEAIAAAAQSVHRRLAVIASGDMSHCLKPGAPAGFHPQAHQFDEAFMGLMQAGDYRGIQHIPAELRELAAEDAADSTLVAAAAGGWATTGHRVLSYEAPFGVGYGVVILLDRISKTEAIKEGPHDGTVLPGVARQAVTAELHGNRPSPPTADGDYLSARRGVFVTVRHRNGNLRGCVGTIEPVCSNLVEETWRNALMAAFQDPRFPPVTTRELPQLGFQISVLHSMEAVADPSEHDTNLFGVVVSTPDGRRGVLLPGIEEIKTAAEQLRLARKKGGILSGEPVSIWRFQVDHFSEPAKP